MHDINIKDEYGHSIICNLSKYNYIYINGEFIKFEDTKI